METYLDAALRLTAPIGNLEAAYEYLNVQGIPVFYNLRIVEPNGRKTFRMMSSTGNGFELRRFESLKPQAGWPLYGLATLERPGAIWVVEGEKDGDNLAALGLPCVTSGSTSTDGNADWSPLARRYVILWPDNDNGGKSYTQRIAKVLRQLGCNVTTVDVDALGLGEKEDASDWLARHPDAGANDVLALPTKSPDPAAKVPDSPLPNGQVTPEEETPLEKQTPPTAKTFRLEEEAFHGPAGIIVKRILPQTEADEAALLLNLLSAFGNIAGRSAYFVADAAKHFPILFVVTVGKTSQGAKGTGWRQILNVVQFVDEIWVRDCVQGGLSSGEGLIEALTDEKDKEGNVTRVVDKRIFVIEEEFSKVFAVMKREGNTVSGVIRQCWDSGNLQTMTRRKTSLRVEETHPTIGGHITPQELNCRIDATEIANGFANRFLWPYSERSKYLPEGGNLTADDYREMGRLLKNAVDFAKQPRCLQRTKAATRLWRRRYKALADGEDGLVGELVARGRPQVMRLAMIYALLDQTEFIDEAHLKAAFAVWDYCTASVRMLFGDATGDPVADQILAALREREEMTRTEIRDLFSRHVAGPRIETALTVLAAQKLATKQLLAGEGRSVELWTACRATKATKATERGL
jgi:Protein of unknown function (DUF3987)